MPRVTIIVLSWNALDLLKSCFASVAAINYPNLEVIYADNASTDGSARWIAQQFPNVRVLQHEENFLFCRGNNEAIRQGSGKYIVLLNNDIETPSDWLHPLVEAAEADERIGALQPKILQYRRREWFGYGGAAGGFLDRMGYAFARGHILHTKEPDTGQYDDACDLDYAGGCALFLRASALERSGLLDERFQMHMEEIDLCWRLRALGYRIGYVPESHVFHVRGDTEFNYVPWRLYYNIRNSLWMLYKNLVPQRFWIVLLQKVVIEAALALRLLAQGRPAGAVAILRGYRDAHLQRHQFRDDRASRAVEGSYRGSILWDYYVRGRKTFGALPAKRMRR